jgi:hypothetical protein
MRQNAFSEYHSQFKLRLRDPQMIFAEFMDLFSMFAFSIMKGQPEMSTGSATTETDSLPYTIY